MSHVTQIKLKVTDLDALDEACQELGLELRRDKRTFAWWGHFVGDSHDYGEITPDRMGTCAHAIGVPGETPRNGSGGPWEIGVLPASDGAGFVVGYDSYGSAGEALTRKVGYGASRLKQEYAAAVASKKARATLTRQGFTLSRENLAGGRIRLRLRKR